MLGDQAWQLFLSGAHPCLLKMSHGLQHGGPYSVELYVDPFTLSFCHSVLEVLIPNPEF